MSDVHRLPLLGHDLPEPVAPTATTKVQVFKDGGRWCWYHDCGTAWDWAYWETAYFGALAHARKCC